MSAYLGLVLLCRRRRKNGRRHWVHPINQKRLTFGEFHQLYPDLRKDPERFKQYFRMFPEKFDELRSKVHPIILTQPNNFRRHIGTEERLMVTLR
jgi:hypothetical protein